MFKKVTTRITAAVLSLLLIFSATAGAIDPSVTLRKDKANIYLKYITGFADNTVRPDALLTRAQGAKMLSYVLNTDDVQQSARSFTDVARGYWGYQAIATLSAAGVIGGYSDGTFRPEKGLTRAEFATILARIVSPQSGSADFTDIEGHWAAADINALSAAGVIGGYSDGTFRPDRTLTRAEAVKLINRVVGVQIDPSENRELFRDLTPKHWAYYEMMAVTSTTALEETSSYHANVAYEDIDYIDLEYSKISDEIDNLLNEFPKATAIRQGKIFQRISSIEMEISHAITMSEINSKRNVTSERDLKNMKNASACLQLVSQAKEKRYQLLSYVKDANMFCGVIGMDISDIPEPSAATPDELVALQTEMQGYESDFSQIMYANSITYNGKQYSLSQAEQSDDIDLYRLALDYYVAHEQELGQIFDNLVNVRTRIANYFGAETFTDIGYLYSGKSAYSPEDVAPLRADIKKYIAPLYSKLVQAQRGVKNGYRAFDVESYYETDNGERLTATQDYLRAFSSQTRQVFDYMKTNNLFDTKPRENKATGAFTQYISLYGSPFLFMNESGSADDAVTFSHEFGHAVQAFRAASNGYYTSDIAEIASYGMEMLIMHAYDDIFGKNAEDIQDFAFYGDLNLLLNTAMMDEFQYVIYSNPNMTIAERNKKYAEISKAYFPDFTINHPAHTKGIVWSNAGHIYTSPYYSIDYTLALTAAFQLWEIGETEGFDRQFETYMSIVESPLFDYGIEAVVEYAGLRSPFESGIIQSIASKLDDMFRTSKSAAWAS